MKLSPRIWIPVSLALLLCIGAGAFFLWHIKTSIALIEKTTNIVRTTSNRMIDSIREVQTPADTLALDAQALTLLREGEALMLQGEVKKAEEKFAGSVQAGGGAPALRKLLEAELQRRNYDGAQETLNQLEKAGAKRENVTLFSGLLALHQGDAKKAQSRFDTIKGTPEGSYGSALVLIASGAEEQAHALLKDAAAGSDPVIRSYAKILVDAYDEYGLFPESKTSHRTTLLARALAQMNECEVALPLLQKVTSEEAEYRDAWIVKGYCELTSERFDEALTSLEQAYNIDPEKPEVQYFLSRTYFALGDPQNAVTFLQYAILNGFQPERNARLLLARYAVELGNTDLALEQYQALIDDPQAPISTFQKFVDLALSLKNKEQQAYNAAKLAESKWPEEQSVLIMLAKTEIAIEKKEDARGHLESVLVKDPGNEEAKELMKKMTNAK